MGRAEFNAVYAWLPVAARDVLWESYEENGTATMWTDVRQDSRYEQWFPGNLTEDGRVRYQEGEYAATLAKYDDVFSSVGITGEALKTMQARYGELIRGDVMPDELETYRIRPMFERIVNASEAIKSWYSNQYGVNLSTTELLLSAIDPNLGDSILTKQISFAEIGGEAAARNYDLSTQFVELLASEGMDRGEANELFGSAERMLPLLGTLAKRHNDPDDTFDITEFVGAGFLSDAEQQGRIQRLTAQERSMFGSGTSVQRDQQGSLTGLTAE